MSTIARHIRLPGRTRSLLARLLAADQMHRSRMHLNDLPQHILDDIGLTHDDLRREKKQSPWNPPPWWNA